VDEKKKIGKLVSEAARVVDGESEIAGLRRWRQRWNGDSMAARPAPSALVDGRRPCRDFCPFLPGKLSSISLSCPVDCFRHTCPCVIVVAGLLRRHGRDLRCFSPLCLLPYLAFRLNQSR
jgi:hypothetical protein